MTRPASVLPLAMALALTGPAAAQHDATVAFVERFLLGASTP